jgi:protein required for attachment to host cells
MPLKRDVSRVASRWIIVANESVAEFYAFDTDSRSLAKTFEIHNDTARTKTADLISDRAGRSFDSFGRGRHALSGEVSPRESAALRFVGVIVDWIVKANQQGRVANYALVAAPHFLGHLRKALRRTAIGDPYVTIDKDVVGHDIQKIERLVSTA